MLLVFDTCWVQNIVINLTLALWYPLHIMGSYWSLVATRQGLLEWNGIAWMLVLWLVINGDVVLVELGALSLLFQSWLWINNLPLLTRPPWFRHISSILLDILFTQFGAFCKRFLLLVVLDKTFLFHGDVSQPSRFGLYDIGTLRSIVVVTSKIKIAQVTVWLDDCWTVKHFSVFLSAIVSWDSRFLFYFVWTDTFNSIILSINSSRAWVGYLVGVDVVWSCNIIIVLDKPFFTLLILWIELFLSQDNCVSFQSLEFFVALKCFGLAVVITQSLWLSAVLLLQAWL